MVIDLDNCEGVDVKWRSPMHLQLAAKDMQDAKKVVPGICLEVVGKPRPILEMMASVCFHGIPEAGLMKLIRHLGIEMPPNPSLLTKMATLLKEILECSDAELAQLLEMRLDKSQEEFMQLCEMDDVADLCETREDGKILEKEVEQTKAGLEVQASYCKELRELVISVGSKGAKAKGTKGSIKSSSSSS